MPDLSHLSPQARARVEANGAVVRYLREHPGATARDVYRAGLNREPFVMIVFRVAALERTGIIEFRGRDDHGDRRYYVKEDL